MIIIGDVKFEIKQKSVSNQITNKRTALELPKDFILEYTTANEKEAEKLIGMIGADEIVDFILSKISLESDKAFANNVNLFVKKIEEDISYIMMLELTGIGYKISDLFDKTRSQIFEIFMLELMSKQKDFNVDNFIRNIEGRYSEENVNAFKNMFKLGEESEPDSKEDINQLINELDGI